MSDHSSTESDEMTAETQNQHNLETDSINSILGNFMEANEETFEELVGGFLYLTMDDVQNSTCLSVASTVGISEERVVVLEDLTPKAACNATNNYGGSEDIEEEILQDDSACKQTNENALFRHRPASLTKFDNFVISEGDSADETDDRPGGEDTGGDDKGVNDDDEDNDWLPSSGYMASFAAEQSTTDSTEQATSQASSQPNTEAPNPSDRSPQKSATVSSPIKPTSSATPTPTHHGTATETSDSECDEFSTACDVQLKVAPLSSDHGPTSETSDFEGDEFSTECEAESKLAVWGLNPGEVEEDEVDAMPVTQGINMMEFTMKVAAIDDSTDNVNSSAANNAENCSDDVVAFSLDEDFDYDNVAYTPKFTREEMAYLTAFVPKNS